MGNEITENENTSTENTTTESTETNQEEKTTKKRNYKPFLWILWLLFFIPVLSFTTIFTLISYGKMGYMPDFKELEDPRTNLASEILSSDNKILGKFYRENRTIVHFEDISPFLVNALVATEDVRFYDHSGIDSRALLRVLAGVVTLNNRGGGSTITQQLAKNLFPRDTTRYSRKISRYLNIVKSKFKEWVTAVRLERNYTKEEIIVMYLNTVSFGNNAYGIKSAARTYFNTSSDSLNIEQASLLIGMLKAPSKYNPRRHPEVSKERRDLVLSQMKKYKYITEETYDSLINISIALDFNTMSHNFGLATYFREYIRTIMQVRKPIRDRYASYQEQQFKDDSLEWDNNPLYGWCNKNPKPNGDPYNLYEDGLQIYTTINSKMQQYAEEAVSEHLATYLQPLFYKHKKSHKKAPFSYKLSDKQIDKIIYNSMRRSERYRVLRKANLDSAAIRENFEKPIEMTVFRWKSKEEIEKNPNDYYEEFDTIMSPVDSIIYYKYLLRAGFMSMEPQTGYVRAYVGGINFTHFKYDHVKTSRRQVGSTFKPFLYTLAMMNGYSPCYKIENIPWSIEMPDNQPLYTPTFSSEPEQLVGKMISLKQGLGYSLNQISAWLMKKYNPEAVIKIAREMGVTSPIDPVPSLCTGSAEVTLCEMVGAYGTFANKGFHTQPVFVSRIEDKNGNIISSFRAKQEEAITEETAHLMVEMMRGVTEFGTGWRLRYRYKFKNEIAGKTGTTNNNSDGWFIGITPNLVSGAWVGGEERSIRFASTTLGQGANMALPIWALYMKKVYADESLHIEPEKFERIPAEKLSVETDCGKYEQQNMEESQSIHSMSNNEIFN